MPGAAWQALAKRDWAGALALAGPGSHHLRALAKWGSGDVDGALAAMELAVVASPQDARILSDLGVIRYQLEDWAGAALAFAACLRETPSEETSLLGLGDALLRMRRHLEAVALALSWVAADPACAAALRLAARAYSAGQDVDQAASFALRSLAIEPESTTTLTLLGSVFQKRRRYVQSLLYHEGAARLRPRSGDAQARLAASAWDAGEMATALEARARALRLGVHDRGLRANMCWLALHDPMQTAEGLLAAHRTSCTVAVPAFVNPREPGRRLRIGYLSGEFVSNPAYCFLAPWLGAHDPACVETFYYMTRPGDPLTADYEGFAHHWREVCALSDDRLFELIREDAIDILVDLSGHFEDNRLSVFARKPAPVQATFPNYPGTTGVDAIDYILTDHWTTPAGSEFEYAESPWRLSCGYLVFGAAPDASPASELPALTNGYVTFGLFQRPGKLNDAVWNAVAAVLLRTPDSRLSIHFASAELDEEGSEQREILLRPLERRGVERSRVRFQGLRFGASHFAAVASADVALDTFPYNGQTTTCDCLWMGVPVVTVAGSTHVSRVGGGLLRRMGLDRFVAPDVAGYIETAVALAGDLDALRELRVGLRGMMLASPLMDGRRLAREIEAAYREMWVRWCGL